MILACTCIHAGQDLLHGKGRRVYNEGKTAAKCTVCGNQKSLTSEQIKDKNAGKKK